VEAFTSVCGSFAFNIRILSFSDSGASEIMSNTKHSSTSESKKLKPTNDIFDFLAKIQSVQTKSYLKICAARKNIPLGRKESDNARQKLELKTNYQDGQLTRLQYVKRMAFKALPVSYKLTVLYVNSSGF
jgi:hypothetical protein